MADCLVKSFNRLNESMNVEFPVRVDDDTDSGVSVSDECLYPPGKQFTDKHPCIINDEILNSPKSLNKSHNDSVIPEYSRMVQEALFSLKNSFEDQGCPLIYILMYILHHYRTKDDVTSVYEKMSNALNFLCNSNIVRSKEVSNSLKIQLKKMHSFNEYKELVSREKSDIIVKPDSRFEHDKSNHNLNTKKMCNLLENQMNKNFSFFDSQEHVPCDKSYIAVKSCSNLCDNKSKFKLFSKKNCDLLDIKAKKKLSFVDGQSSIPEQRNSEPDSCSELRDKSALKLITKKCNALDIQAKVKHSFSDSNSLSRKQHEVEHVSCSELRGNKGKFKLTSKNCEISFRKDNKVMVRAQNLKKQSKFNGINMRVDKNLNGTKESTPTLIQSKPNKVKNPDIKRLAPGLGSLLQCQFASRKQVLKLTRMYLKKRKLWRKDNQIICDQELEKALDVKNIRRKNLYRFITRCLI